MKKILKIILCLILCCSIFFSSLIVSAAEFSPFVNSEIKYGYTSNLHAYGFSYDAVNGNRYDYTEIGTASSVLGNSINLVFGRYSHYQGYEVILDKNQNFKCQIGNLYNVQGSVLIRFQQLEIYNPRQLVLYLGVGDDILFSVNWEEIEVGLNSNKEYIFNIDKDIYASSESTLDSLTLYFYFYDTNTTSEDFYMDVSEFSVVPTQGLSYQNVLFDRDIFLTDYMQMSRYNYGNKWYNNSSFVYFGSHEMVDHFYYYGFASQEIVLARGLSYRVTGTVTIDFTNHPIPTFLDIFLGEGNPSHPNVNFIRILGLHLNEAEIEKIMIDDSSLTFTFNSVVTIKNNTINCLYIYSNGDDDHITGLNIDIYLSQFSIEHVNPLSSDYQRYLSSEEYLLNSIGHNIGSITPLFDSVVNQIPSYASAFHFFGYVFNLGLSFPFFNVLFYVIGTFSLGALLFGISYSGIKLARNSKSKSKGKKG